MGSPKTSTKLPTSTNRLKLTEDFYTVHQAALILQKSDWCITRWCEAGKLSALPKKYGSRFTWRIPKASIEHLLNKTHTLKNPRATLKTIRNQAGLLKPFAKACELGILNTTNYSQSTIQLYVIYLSKFFEHHTDLTYAAAKAFLSDTKKAHAEKRLAIYRALVCFCKYLISEDLADNDLLEQLKSLKPEGNRSPKRLAINESQLQTIENACKTVSDQLLISLLASTGIRASECTGLKVSDVSLTNRPPDELPYLEVLGKGGKHRKVGLTAKLQALLAEYLAEKHANEWLFPNAKGEQMSRWGLRDRLERIGKRAGVSVRPHALRRAFVTINANKGRSLVMLQKACGHTRIETTRLYCRTSEQEMLASMSGWE